MFPDSKNLNNVLLIVNTGTPDAPDRKNVRKYLSEFLNDPYVMDIPGYIRKILVNGIIVPFRSRHSSRLYRELWTAEGSPLLQNLNGLACKLQRKLDGWRVLGAMRYGNPSLEKILEGLGKSTVNKLTVLPLYPQFASSTTGSVRALLNSKLSEWNKKPELRFIEQFYSDLGFIRAFAGRIRSKDPGRFDHLLFSYHGLPVRHIEKIHPDHGYKNCNCVNEFPGHDSLCYRAQCYDTSRLLAKELHLKDGSWSVSFQSRLTRHWIGPFTDSVLKQLASDGKKRVLVAAPSFTADCLETLHEIGHSYRELFIKAGGKELQLCESLNDNDEWMEAIINIIS